MSHSKPVLEASREHLHEAGESYLQHLAFASLVAALLLAAAIACFIHALVPAFCRRSASRIVALLTRLFGERDRLRDTVREGSGPLVLTMLLLLCIPPLALMIAAGGQVLLLPLAALCLAVPLAFLIGNPDLEPVD
ncbi:MULTISPECIES: DUF6356 family protein [Sphingomonas]|uniref:DUF6356 family protein n=1 Tax=Sphingomonas TaxID=13687 RepID=UPI001964616D|nr:MULTISPECIES: DUF6356 family protein [Sphingomonas]